MTREFDFLTPGTAMKWNECWMSPSIWYFGQADDIVKFAYEHSMKVNGHTLVWDKFALPSWVNGLSPSELKKAVDDYIYTLVNRYKGKIYSWDVVSEAVDDKEGLRKGLFLEKLGENYIADAFRIAHETDPNALLFYNDYNAEFIGDSKSDRIYTLVKGPRQTETPPI
jgi:endo-1,4-beta-xylanase